MLKCCYSRRKYLSKLKQHELPDALSKEILFKCALVMSYEQFIVPIGELTMLSWQQLLSYYFHNVSERHLAFNYFLKLEVHILVA